MSSCGISQGKIISVNWLLSYRFFEDYDIALSTIQTKKLNLYKPFTIGRNLKIKLSHMDMISR